MANINEMESTMTLFFSKRTGEIKCSSTGVQDMNYFGSDKEDYEQIWDFIVVQLDRFVLDNSKNFIVNVDTKQIEMVPQSVPNYPIAGGESNGVY